MKNNQRICSYIICSYLFFMVSFIFSPFEASAEKKQNLPRFASIKASEANTRTGPGMNYPLSFLYQYRGIPVEIIAEYDQWRKIRDINGDEGWMHSSILSSKRFVMVKGQHETLLHVKDNAKSEIIARLEPYLNCELIKISNLWCKIRCAEYTGWAERVDIWGLYDHE
ncbi:MAG: hypothetical protein EB127_10920 [Alphaproteobacteria bacterium]|nr:hypothetical protein [Alphaproteobacteria bacterium]